jgi:hypothetical protein
LLTLYSDVGFNSVRNEDGFIGFNVFAPDLMKKMDEVTGGIEVSLIDYMGKLKSIKSHVYAMKYGRRRK